MIKTTLKTLYLLEILKLKTHYLKCHLLKKTY